MKYSTIFSKFFNIKIKKYVKDCDVERFPENGWIFPCLVCEEPTAYEVSFEYCKMAICYSCQQKSKKEFKIEDIKCISFDKYCITKLKKRVKNGVFYRVITEYVIEIVE